MRLGTPEKSGNLRGNYTRSPSRNCESARKKMIGKPYSGKSTVRFDEGELEIELMATTPALYFAVIVVFERCMNLPRLSKNHKFDHFLIFHRR